MYDGIQTEFSVHVSVTLGSFAFGFLTKLLHLFRRTLAVHPRHHKLGGKLAGGPGGGRAYTLAGLFVVKGVYGRMVLAPDVLADAGHVLHYLG